MAIGETIWPQPVVDEKEVLALTGRKERVVALKPSGFEGSVAAWARDRMRKYGDTIVPKIVLVQPIGKKAPLKSHRVAWVFHEGVNEQGQPFCGHHLVCDCAGDVDAAQTEEEKQAVIDECPALEPAIELQANNVDNHYRITDTLSALGYYPFHPMAEQSVDIQDFVSHSVRHLLERDHVAPQDWIANTESGYSHLSLLGRIYGIPNDDLMAALESMNERDTIETEEGFVGLSARYKQIIDLNQQVNRIISEAEQGIGGLAT